MTTTLLVPLLAAAAGAALAWPPDPEPPPPAPPVVAEPPGRVVVHRPAGPPTVGTDLRTPQGESVRLACSTCHGSRDPDPNTRRSDQLDTFHQGLAFDHGPIGCLACHDPGDYDALRLADGRRVPYPEVMEVCGQCHGPQLRDYRRGSHGGMTGYWDLRRGSRERNHCIHCHDPHVPAFQPVLPVFPPRDGRPGGDSHG